MARSTRVTTGLMLFVFSASILAATKEETPSAEMLLYLAEFDNQDPDPTWLQPSPETPSANNKTPSTTAKPKPTIKANPTDSTPTKTTESKPPQ